MRHSHTIVLSLCMLATWGWSTAEAQVDRKRGQTQDLTIHCPDGRPIFFDDQCRGSRFFEQFEVPGYEILQVTGCVDRSVNDPGACGLSIGITESNSDGHSRTVTVTNVKTGGGKSNTGLQLQGVGSTRNGYRVISILSTRQQVFPSGNRRVTVTHAEFSKQGQRRNTFRQRMTFTDLESTALTFTYQMAMDICSNVPLSDLFQDGEEQSLTCNNLSCQYTSNRSEYVERLDGQLITEANVSLRGFGKKGGVLSQGQTQGGVVLQGRIQGSENYDECISGQGTYGGHTIQAYSQNSSSSPSCGPEIDALGQLPEQICNGLSGALGGFIGLVTNPFLVSEWNLILPLGAQLTSFDGQPLSVGNYVSSNLEAGGEGFEWGSENNPCGLIFDGPTTVEFNDFFCGLDEVFGGGCNGTHVGVPVIVSNEDGVSCQGTADVECSSSRSDAQLGDADCECEPTSISVDTDSCQQ